MPEDEKRRPCTHLKENQVFVFKCMGAAAYATCGEHAAAEHSSLQQSQHYFQLRWDKGECWVSRRGGSLEAWWLSLAGAARGWVDLSLCIANRAKAPWNLGLTLPEDRSPAHGAGQGDVLVGDTWPRGLSLRNACSWQLLQSCSAGNILPNRGTHLNALLAQLS